MPGNRWHACFALTRRSPVMMSRMRGACSGRALIEKLLQALTPLAFRACANSAIRLRRLRLWCLAV
jgi:hypothetical protein